MLSPVVTTGSIQALTATSVLLPDFAYDLHARPTAVVPVFNLSSPYTGFYTAFSMHGCIPHFQKPSVEGHRRLSVNTMTNHFYN